MKKLVIKDPEKTKLGHFLFDRPILKFTIFVVIQFLLIWFEGYFPYQELLRVILSVIRLLISIYFILIIVYFIRHALRKLLNPENLFGLISTYALFVLGIILLLTTLYNVVEVSKLGYIKYGQCSNKFDSSMISNDPTVTREYFYFAAVTFFTVGYGDICPMGLMKEVSILTAFLGHLVSVVIVALIINNYLMRRRKEDSDS